MSDPSRLFREEAVRHHAGPRAEGDVLRLPPGWTRWTYRLLVVLVAAGLAFLIFGRTAQYAAGPALVQLAGGSELTAPGAGVVAAVAVEPGGRVRAGDVIVRLHDEEESADWRRARDAFEAQLAERLRDPANESARTALPALRGEMERAAARMDERRIVAPEDAVVGSIRVRAGRPVERGQVVATLVPAAPKYELVALLPGRFRPMLRAGMDLRVEMAGFPRARMRLVLRDVGDRVVGPAEARRTLGAALADVVQPTGPVVIAHADLPAPGFTANGVAYAYHDGMAAFAEAPVRSESILSALLPGLESARAD